MNRPGKFTNSSFHKETGVHGSSKTSNPDFVEELVETGRPNWKKAPKSVRNRYYGIYMVLLSIPVILVPSIELYRRLEGNSTKKVQEGELQGKEVRKFGEKEKWERERNSFMYKVFGKDFFLEGSTSKTMRESSDKDKPK